MLPAMLSMQQSSFSAGGGSSQYGTLIDDDSLSGTGSAAVSIGFSADGGAVLNALVLGTIATFDWCSPFIASSGITVRLHVNSGTNPTNGTALDEDLALSSNRTWQWSRFTAGTTTANVTVTLKNAAGNTIATATYDVSVTV